MAPFDGLPSRSENAQSGWSYLPIGGSGDSSSVATGTIDQLFRETASRWPAWDAIRWLEGDTVRAVSWDELFVRSTAVGRAIRHREPRNRRVGIAGRDRVQWILAMYGAARAGCSIVPLPVRDTPDGVAARCDHADLDLIVSVGGTSFADKVPASVKVVDVAELEAEGGSMTGDPEGAAADDPFLLQFTSGTTGRPKIAVLTHRAVLGAAQHYMAAAGADDGTTMFNPLPLDHIGGSVGAVICSLCIGGAYVAVDKLDPATIVRTIRLVRPSMVGLVPTMVLDILALDGVTAEDFESVETMIGGASSVEPAMIDSIEDRLGIRFVVAYGQSEAPVMTISARDDPLYERTRTLGRPLPGRDYCVVDGDRVVAEGDVGELCVRGPLIMAGYLRDNGTIEPAYDENGWMRTGDLCSMSNGVVKFHSRLRDVVVRGGENLYPAEIESVLAGCEGVQEVAVFGIPDERLGECAVAAVRVSVGSPLTESELAAFAESKLPRRMRPTRWFMVDDFPRTATGKIRKAELSARLT
ncbi:class I adenylate-forming enzyme family protein [Rhodococcus sp. B50]|uniref:class I adenylate-forming enzyme family protein n=1 Tax=Rhodococcus sp. B50 TaxID=2682847 RepID=UPI001BD35855|nr:class I adenylate-forming enzyme family protein [Rhodococcus sp. B50]MBS9376449.1 3-[(3aS,4S,7aS)-7a-methyl-1,5-dioxo-octahydro-1H-inden-4-yl]propanoyl:CoA ligase [Rhodococcus sp. B50]